MHFASYFLWCGHVARLTTADPQRETSRISTLKSMEWLRNLKKELGSQCHGRRFRVWRWEQAVAQCVGTEWSNVAQGRAKMDAMIKLMNSVLISKRSMMCGIPHGYTTPAAYAENSSETRDTDEDENLNTWNALLKLLTMPGSSPVIQRSLQDWEVRRVALSCHFSLDIL